MRAILIDPVAKTVSEVEHNGDYRNIYTLLSDTANGLDVDTFTLVRIDDAESIYVDDEGLLKDPEYFFKWQGYPQPLAGRGLILSSDEEGESIGTSMTLAEVEAKVSFPSNLAVARFDPIPEGTTTNMPGFGEVPVFGSVPVFKVRG